MEDNKTQVMIDGEESKRPWFGDVLGIFYAISLFTNSMIIGLSLILGDFFRGTMKDPEVLISFKENVNYAVTENVISDRVASLIENIFHNFDVYFTLIQALCVFMFAIMMYAAIGVFKGRRIGVQAGLVIYSITIVLSILIVSILSLWSIQTVVTMSIYAFIFYLSRRCLDDEYYKL